MEAYADPLKYYEPDQANTTNVPESIQKVKSNDKELKDLNLNNIKDINEEQFVELFEAMNNGSRIVDIHLSGQAQSNMGYRVESRIANSICKNTTLIKVGLKFQFGEVYDRVMNHLIDNIDRRRKDRVKNEGPSQVKWKPSASTIG